MLTITPLQWILVYKLFFFSSVNVVFIKGRVSYFEENSKSMLDLKKDTKPKIPPPPFVPCSKATLIKHKNARYIFQRIRFTHCYRDV